MIVPSWRAPRCRFLLLLAALFGTTCYAQFTIVSKVSSRIPQALETGPFAAAPLRPGSAAIPGSQSTRLSDPWVIPVKIRYAAGARKEAGRY